MDVLVLLLVIGAAVAAVLALLGVQPAVKLLAAGVVALAVASLIQLL